MREAGGGMKPGDNGAGVLVGFGEGGMQVPGGWGRGACGQEGLGCWNREVGWAKVD